MSVCISIFTTLNLLFSSLLTYFSSRLCTIGAIAHVPPQTPCLFTSVDMEMLMEAVMQRLQGVVGCGDSESVQLSGRQHQDWRL